MGILRRYLNEVRRQNGDAIVVDQPPPPRQSVAAHYPEEQATDRLLDTGAALQAFVHRAVIDPPAGCPLRDNRVYRALPLTVIKLALATGENHGLYRLRSKNFSLTGRQLMAISWPAKQEEQGDVNPFFGPRNSGSHLTRRWREADSNFRFPARKGL